MIEPKVYVCHSDEDCKDAAELSGLIYNPYGKPRPVYPYYIGKFLNKNGNTKTISTPNVGGDFDNSEWFPHAIEIPRVDIYEKFGMSKGDEDV